MTDGSAPIVPGYHERCQTRASVITRWMLLVPGCALPLLAATWDTLSAPEVAGVAAGVATWTGVMIRFHVWRLVQGDYGETTRLTSSAASFLVFQWCLGAFAPREAQFVFYSPAVVLWSLLEIPGVDLPDPGITYLLTLACGAQALGCILGLSWALGRLGRHLNRQG